MRIAIFNSKPVDGIHKTGIYKTAANIAVMLVLLSLPPSLMAADWTVYQEATLSSPEVRLSQENSTSSHQAINGAILELTADSFVSLTQQATINSNQLTLTQSGSATNSNVQAVNIASAQSISELTQTTTQTTGTATLTQNITAGTGNIQAINYAFSSGNIHNAHQTFQGQSMVFEKSLTTPTGNIQAVNYAKATSYTGDLTQTVVLDSLMYFNFPGVPEDIRINSIQGATGSAQVMQNVTIEGMTITPDSAATIIINYIAP